MKYANWILLLTVVGLPAEARQNVSAALGLSGLGFDYREYNQYDTRLNRENGILPGVTASLQLRYRALRVGADVAAYGNDVNYEGRTQRGRALKTRTDELIVGGSANAAYTFAHIKHVTLAINGLLGLRHWERNIRSTPLASGLFEVYRWPHFGAGLDVVYRTRRDISMGIKAAYIKAFASQITVDFDGRYDRTTMPLNNGDGMKIDLPITLPWGRARLTFNGFVMLWRFPRSAAHPVKYNGRWTGALITEPESVTLTYGLTAALTR